MFSSPHLAEDKFLYRADSAAYFNDLQLGKIVSELKPLNLVLLVRN